MIDKLKNLFVNKKILILGMGREGESSQRFLKKFFSNVNVSTADQKFSDGYLNNLKEFDLIIKSPGISWNIEEIEEARKTGVKFISQTQLFLELFKSQTIGITGTKGKSTTASLIYHILKEAKMNVKLVGNIGKPVLDNIDGVSDKSFFIYEMSSHQLSDVTMSPHIAVFLNIYPEHLDYYSNFKEYFNAKTNIARFQSESDIFIYNSDFKEISNFADTIQSKKYSFSSKDKLEDWGIKLDANPLLGKHNLENIKASVLVARKLNVQDNTIRGAIESFKSLDDRLEFVANIDNISFINDGLATIPQATIAAVKSLEKENNITLILGGFDRGINFDILGKFLSKTNNVKNIILIGQTAKKINQVLVSNKFQGNIYDLGVSPMKDVVERAFVITKPKGTVLLSPSSTSFDMFKDYKDRDDQFKKAVKEIYRK